VSPLLDNFTVNNLGNLGQAVILWTIKFVRLTSSAVVQGNLLESTADINAVHRPESLLHVVRYQHVGGLGQSVEQAVFESECGCRSYNCGLWEDLASNLLGLPFCAVEF
jgi:hypothetical protein